LTRPLTAVTAVAYQGDGGPKAVEMDEQLLPIQRRKG
jgi:hypothetical protein